MTAAREGCESREGDGEVVGAQCGGWYIIGVDDGKLGEIDALVDRLTVSQKFIMSKQTVDLQEYR